MMYKMIWFERGNPDNRGEGLPIEDAKQAEQVVRWHNWACPRYGHKAIRIDEQQTTQQ